MPILKREANLFPPDLFDLRESPWFVLHVRSRQEKAVARFLSREHLAFFLPQLARKERKNGRTFTSWLPLFPGYVFVRVPRSAQAALWRSSAVVRALPVDDQGTLQDELVQLWRLQESGATLTPHPYLALGDEVRIAEGVFAGYRGVVVREKGTSLLVVSVSVIHHSVAVQLQRDAVVPIAM